jgi:hypothetical protein
MAAVESAWLSHLASQPPKGFNVLHQFRIRPLNFYKDKKLIATNRCFYGNIFAILLDCGCAFHPSLECLNISLGHIALFDSGHR